MDTIKIIGSPLYQWEIGRKVAITPPAKTKLSKVEFAHKGDTETLPVLTKEENGVIVADVPNILLQSAEHIFVYLLYTDENCLETTLFRILPVISRPRPADYVYTETEVMTWKALDQRLQDLEGEGLANAVAEYLAENPIEAGATDEEAAQIAQNKEDIEKLNTDKLDADKLPEAVNGALAQAKASGEFDGAPGDPGSTPVKGVDYFTESDKQEIAGRAAGMVEVPASNWNARPGAPGHVLNRTHWVEVAKGEEIPVDGIWNNNNGTEDTFAFYAPVDLEIGKSYVVEWDGVEYQCTAIEFEYQGVSAVGIGNTMLIGGEDTGEPFGIVGVPNAGDAGETMWFALARTPGAVLFSIYHGTDVVHKLPEKYLDLPTNLPNPNALTFTGAVSATYDGSEAVNVEIPAGGGGGGSGNSGYDILIDITTTEAVTEIQSDIIGVEAAEKFKMAHEVFLWVYVPFDASDTASTDIGTVTVSVRASSWTWAWLSAIPIIPNPTQTYTKGGYIFAKASIPPYNYTSFPTCKSYAEYIYGIWGLAGSDKYVTKANDPSGDFANMVGGKSAMFKLVGSRNMPAGTRLVAGVIA